MFFAPGIIKKLKGARGTNHWKRAKHSVIKRFLYCFK